MPKNLAIAILAPLFIAGEACAGGSPPVDAGFVFDIPAGAVCDFAVNWTVTGRSSVIDLPGGRQIVTSPQARVVVTNVDEPANSVSLIVTAVSHIATDANGQAVYTITGRSLIADPVTFFMAYAAGTFSFRIDPVTFELLDFTGHGQMRDVCAMIE